MLTPSELLGSASVPMLLSVTLLYSLCGGFNQQGTTAFVWFEATLAGGGQ